jgi:hypothetical protein
MVSKSRGQTNITCRNNIVKKKEKLSLSCLTWLAELDDHLQNLRNIGIEIRNKIV